MGKKPKILVVGSFVMDQIVTTRVFPRQGQTILAERFNKAPGGKGANQAVQMARLGAQVTMCGKLGHDANGDEMRRTCEEAGIDTSCILYDDNAASGCSVIILEEQPNGGTENRILVVPGANMTITPEDVAFLKDRIAEFDLVVLQLEIPMEINTIVAKYAHDKGVPVMLNPAPSAPLPEELLACLTYLSPNEHEARDLSGVAIGPRGQPRRRGLRPRRRREARRKGRGKAAHHHRLGRCGPRGGRQVRAQSVRPRRQGHRSDCRGRFVRRRVLRGGLQRPVLRRRPALCQPHGGPDSLPSRRDAVASHAGRGRCDHARRRERTGGLRYGTYLESRL